MKLVISELRKALKTKLSFGDVVVHENFLCLIQVLLLEEDGYLGYVDSVTPAKKFALELVCMHNIQWNLSINGHCISRSPTL